MVNFVLVHGAMHGGWFWEPVQTRLAELGHTALAPDLPGSGDDVTPRQLVDLDMVSRRIADVVLDAAADGPVVLVGHSFGGVVIGEVAERVPESLLGLVYVSGVIAAPGQSMVEALGAGDRPLPLLSEDGTVMRPDFDRAMQNFYAACSPDLAEQAARRLGEQATKPLLEPSTVTAERFGAVARAYVECLQDRAVPLEIQRRMQSVLPCAPVHRLDCDHSPQLSRPQELADVLVTIGAEFATRGATPVTEPEMALDQRGV